MSFLNAFRADGASDSTGRKYVSIISHLYKIARKRWQLPVINPVDSIERPCNGKPRKRRLNDGEEEKLIAEFMKEDHKYILPAFLFSVNTAMRRGELLRMEWKHTHFFEDGTGIAHLPETKNDDSRDVPLDLVAVRILKSLRDLDKESAMVFCITQYQLRTRWERVRGAAGLRDLRWHDLRHESTSRFIELGLNVLEAASITGHKTLQMLMDYTHLRAKKLAKKIDELKAV